MENKIKTKDPVNQPLIKLEEEIGLQTFGTSLFFEHPAFRESLYFVFAGNWD